jgi:hypothetical protein
MSIRQSAYYNFKITERISMKFSNGIYTNSYVYSICSYFSPPVSLR